MPAVSQSSAAYANVTAPSTAAAQSLSSNSRSQGEDDEVLEIKVPSDQPPVNPVDQQAFLRKRLDLECVAAVAFSRESSIKSQESAFSMQIQSHAPSIPSQLGSQVVGDTPPPPTIGRCAGHSTEIPSCYL